MSNTPSTPSSKPSSSSETYVLGTDPIELERLGFQHQLWSDAAHALWRRAKIRPGHRVLDVGCGPGFAAVELAQIVTQGLLPATRAGEVVGVDLSPTYLQHLQALAQTRGLTNIKTVLGDVQTVDTLLDQAHASFDLAWARWVFCFVPSPQALIVAVHKLLRPGGYFAVHDYFNYAAMSAMPRRPAIDRAVQATMASWRDHGGDATVAGILPALFSRHGFEVVHIDVHQRLARTNDTMFQWPLSWWRTWGPKLVATGYLSVEENLDLQRNFDEMEASTTDCFLMPPVTELLVRKVE